MTNEDIIRMAREAGTPITPEMKPEDALAIAFALGKAEEREACAEVAAWILKMPENDVSAAIRARGARMINLTREEADGYYCVVCGKFLPLENGVIVHDDVPHPADMKFNDKETTQ